MNDQTKKIYIYQTPAGKAVGAIKIGETCGDVRKRILEQLNTAGVVSGDQVQFELLYETPAVRKDGTPFSDKDVHRVLKDKGVQPICVETDAINKNNTEWYRIDLEQAIHVITQIKKGVLPEKIDIFRFRDFAMRPEQRAAVEKTVRFFKEKASRNDLPAEMMWNAKMRFGKTFTAYQLAKAMNFSKVLVLTYKPAVMDAWKVDLERHKDFADFVFLYGEALPRIDDHLANGNRVVAFVSFQDLLGTDSSGKAIKEKHESLFATTWDLVIIDEFHYGAGTERARDIAERATLEEDEKAIKEIEKAIEKEYEESGISEEEKQSEEIDAFAQKRIKTRFRLYLSGTPFKALATARFPRKAIFNWTYVDEQRAKERWQLAHPNEDETRNPYYDLPQMKILVYKVSDDVLEAARRNDKDEFSLNYFFRAKNGKFVAEKAVEKWLNTITGSASDARSIEEELNEDGSERATGEPAKYPFDPKGGFFDEMDHTLWYLHRVESANAMEALLKRHPVFRNYHVINAAGNRIGTGYAAFRKLAEEIAKHERTITLTVGKLTTGVTVPEWKGVLFLRDTTSPENYFQTAFRAQSPYKDRFGNVKRTCYVFDFSPNRVLKLVAEYNDRLVGDDPLSENEGVVKTPSEKIVEFVRYLPVLQISGNRMTPVNEMDVLTFDLNDVSAEGLAIRFVSSKQIAISDDLLAVLNETGELAKFQDILNRVKKFRKFIDPKTEKDEEQTEILDLDANNREIKELKTKKIASEENDQRIDEEIDKKRKENDRIKQKIREILKTVLGRIPIYMYLTDATEENLEQVMLADEDDMFRKVTGITVEDFNFLVKTGAIRVDSMEGYILKFLELEENTYAKINETVASFIRSHKRNELA